MPFLTGLKKKSSQINNLYEANVSLELVNWHKCKSIILVQKPNHCRFHEKVKQLILENSTPKNFLLRNLIKCYSGFVRYSINFHNYHANTSIIKLCSKSVQWYPGPWYWILNKSAQNPATMPKNTMLDLNHQYIRYKSYSKPLFFFFIRDNHAVHLVL